MGMSEELKPVNCGCGEEAKVDIKLFLYFTSQLYNHILPP